MQQEETFLHPVYSPTVIEFVTVGKEFSIWLETLETQSSKDFVATALKILPLLYLKATMLPLLEAELEEYLEHFVTEEDYEIVKYLVELKMGPSDDYLEVFTAEMQRSDLPLTSTVSENIADIYQDIKDFLMNYRTAITEIMNDALVKLVYNFQTYWGQRLVNVLRALHQVYYSKSDLGDDVEGGPINEENEINTDNWFITQRQRDWQSEHGFLLDDEEE